MAKKRSKAKPTKASAPVAAKKVTPATCESGCSAWAGWLWLVVGVLYLLGDLGYVGFMPQWYVAGFLLLGLHALRGN